MKFILNTAIAPHFCVVFDDHDAVVQKIQWDNFRQDGQKVYDFLQNFNVQDFTFLGGISGPGGFSSLRAGACILNALAFTTGVDIHQVRADEFLLSLFPEGNFVLNSFSQDVFVREGDDLIRLDVQTVAQRFADHDVFVDLLPPEKQKVFLRHIEADFQNTKYEALLGLLSQKNPQKNFTPTYEFAPV